MQDFHRLSVWKKSHDLTLAVYRATRNFPPEEQYGLTSQLHRSCASVPANIAEGCGRDTSADMARFVQIAMGSASETEYHLLLACDLGYFEQDRHANLQRDTVEVKKMLAGLLKSLRS